jgi:hypothetical protein
MNLLRQDFSCSEKKNRRRTGYSSAVKIENQMQLTNHRHSLQPSTSSRPDRPEWLASLAIGDAGEAAVANLLKSVGIAVRKSRDFSTDLEIVGGTVEVKRDLKALSTGAVAVEVAYNNRPSGISSSCAGCWAFVLANGEIVMTSTSRLRAAVADLVDRPAGEGATIRLLPLHTLRAIGVSIGGRR